MRRKDKQVTDYQEIEQIISEAEICHLAMVDGKKPYVVPLNFGYRDKALYFHSALQGRKIDVILKNPDVCFSIIGSYEIVEGDRGCSWSAKFTSVSGEGKASILEEPSEKEEGLKVLMNQYSKVEHSFSQEDLDRILMLKVDILGITGKRSG